MTSDQNSFKVASGSIKAYLSLAASRRLKLKHDHIGNIYNIEGNIYKVFRETVSTQAYDKPTVLVVGFKLKVLRSNKLMHWLFQRICILTTPFWSGIEGFRIKLWMVNPDSYNYLGIYKWQGADQANVYLAYLIPILNFFSVKGSVWYEMEPDKDIEKYLEERSIGYEPKIKDQVYKT